MGQTGLGFHPDICTKRPRAHANTRDETFATEHFTTVAHDRNRIDGDRFPPASTRYRAASLKIITHILWSTRLKREVEWLETGWDGDIGKRTIRCDDNDDDDNDLDLHRDVDLPLQAEFWLLNTPRSADAARSEAMQRLRQAAVAAFTGTFQAAVDMLPNLHTFISRLMSSTRDITTSGYPISARFLQTYQNVTYRTDTQANDGLFLPPPRAMDRPTSTVTRLRWVDNFPGWSYMRTMSPSALERRESLDLCLTPGHFDEQLIADFSAACKRTASRLRHLTVCMDNGSPKLPRVASTSMSSPALALLGPGGFAMAPECALQSITLDSVPMSSKEFMAVIEANARSLRHIHIDELRVTAKMIWIMRELAHLKLDTIEIRKGDRNLIRGITLDSRALVQCIKGVVLIPWSFTMSVILSRQIHDAPSPGITSLIQRKPAMRILTRTWRILPRTGP